SVPSKEGASQDPPTRARGHAIFLLLKAGSISIARSALRLFLHFVSVLFEFLALREHFNNIHRCLPNTRTNSQKRLSFRHAQRTEADFALVLAVTKWRQFSRDLLHS